MNQEFFIAIDFDGTVSPVDITDAVIKKFARPGWEEAEKLWENGLIGSRECLQRQISLIDEPLSELLDYVDGFSVDVNFPKFIDYLRTEAIPFAIISDGFRIFAERLLKNAGMRDMPVYANELTELNGRLSAVFPNSDKYCPSGTCKCAVTNSLGIGIPVILIGDGRSDFGLAEKAAYVISKGKLSRHCEEMGLSYAPFYNFMNMAERLKELSVFIPQFT